MKSLSQQLAKEEDRIQAIQAETERRVEEISQEWSATILRVGVVCTKRGRNNKESTRVLRLAEVPFAKGRGAITLRMTLSERLTTVGSGVSWCVLGDSDCAVAFPLVPMEQDMETLEWATVKDFKSGVKVRAVEGTTETHVGGPRAVTTVHGLARSTSIIPQVEKN